MRCLRGAREGRSCPRLSKTAGPSVPESLRTDRDRLLAHCQISRQVGRGSMSELNRTARIGRLAGLLALTVVTAHAAFAQVVHYPDGKPRLPKWSSLPDWNGLGERDGEKVWAKRIR